MLRIENLSKTYGGSRKAVQNLSIHAEKGDLFGFIGHNGAGKTTTLKCITGILDFEDGDIFIDGHSVKKDPIYCKTVSAYIPDNPELYEYLTGMQYLDFIANVFCIKKSERTEKIKEYTKLFEMEEVLGNLISSYSHGMKQKLIIISALIHSPKLLILDEPFVGLDPKATLTLKNIMKDLCSDGGTVFFSTHVLEVAEKLCNKIAIIRNGESAVMGKTEVLTKDKSLESLFMEVLEDDQ